MAVIIFLPLYMVNVQGVSATQAGASVIPLSLGIVVGAQLSGSLVTKLGRYKGIAIVGSVVAVVAGILLATLGTGTPLWLAIIFMVIAGIGFGPSQSIYALAVQNAVQPQEVGQATSTIQFSRQIGSAIGAAVLGVIFTTTLSGAFDHNLPNANGVHQASQGSRLQSEGPKEIREGFDRVIAGIDPLFALRGADAASGLDRFLNDPAFSAQVREQLKTQFKDGTPAMALDKAWAGFMSPLQDAFLAGNSQEVQKLLEAGSASDGSGKPGLVANMPDFVKAMLVKQAGEPDRAARQAAWDQIAAQFAETEATLADEISAKAAEGAKKGLAETRDTLVTGISTSFAQAISATWLANVFVMVLLALATFLIPGLPLRGKGEHGPSVPGDKPATTVAH